MVSRARVGGNHFRMMAAVMKSEIHGYPPADLTIEQRVVLDDLVRWGYVIEDAGAWRATPAGTTVFDTWQNLKDVGNENH